MRLIDADELLKTFTVNSDGRRILEKDCDNFDITISLKEIKRIIREQPTAYDLDKVIEQLEDIQSSLKKAEKIMDVAYVYSADVDLKILIQKLKAGGMD